MSKQVMQTNRHGIFAVLALGAACSPRPQQPVRIATVEPSPTSAVEDDDVADDHDHSGASPRPLAPACDHGIPPGIVRARFSSADVLELTFTEPVQPTAAVEPRQFRLSLGGQYAEANGQATTYYYDPGGLDALDGRVSFIELRAVDDLTLALRLASPISPEVCEAVDDFVEEGVEDPNVQGGLFLHYHDAGGIVSSSGKHLADIAPHWVTRDAIEATWVGAHVPIEALGPIPCPSSRRGGTRELARARRAIEHACKGG